MKENWDFKKITDNNIFIYVSNKWYCNDGDQVRLYIDEDQGMKLFCFSGLPSSFITLDYVDFSNFNKKLDVIDVFNIADCICSTFCEKENLTVKNTIKIISTIDLNQFKIKS